MVRKRAQVENWLGEPFLLKKYGRRAWRGERIETRQGCGLVRTTSFDSRFAKINTLLTLGEKADCIQPTINLAT